MSEIFYLTPSVQTCIYLFIRNSLVCFCDCCMKVCMTEFFCLLIGRGRGCGWCWWILFLLLLVLFCSVFVNCNTSYRYYTYFFIYNVIFCFLLTFCNEIFSYNTEMAIYIVAIKRRGNKKNSELTTFL